MDLYSDLPATKDGSIESSSHAVVQQAPVKAQQSAAAPAPAPAAISMKLLKPVSLIPKKRLVPVPQARTSNVLADPEAEPTTSAAATTPVAATHTAHASNSVVMQPSVPAQRTPLLTAQTTAAVVPPVALLQPAAPSRASSEAADAALLAVIAEAQTSAFFPSAADAGDEYDPMHPNDFEAIQAEVVAADAAAERQAAMQRHLQEAEAARVAMREEREARERAAAMGGAPLPAGRGRGRGMDLLPAWMKAQLAAEASSSGVVPGPQGSGASTDAAAATAGASQPWRVADAGR